MSATKKISIVPIAVVIIVVAAAAAILFHLNSQGKKALDQLSALAPLYTVTYESAEVGTVSSSITLHNVQIEAALPGEDSITYTAERIEISGANPNLLSGGMQKMADSIVAYNVSLEEMHIDQVRIDGFTNDWKELNELLNADAAVEFALRERMAELSAFELINISFDEDSYMEDIICGRLLIQGAAHDKLEYILFENVDLETNIIGKLELRDVLIKSSEELNAEFDGDPYADYYDVIMASTQPMSVGGIVLTDAKIDTDSLGPVGYLLPETLDPELVKNIQLKNVDLFIENNQGTLHIGNLDLKEIGTWSLASLLMENLSLNVMGLVDVTVEHISMKDFALPEESIDMLQHLASYGPYGMYDYLQYADEYDDYEDDDYIDFEDERFWTADGEFDADAFERYMIEERGQGSTADADEDLPGNLLAPIFSHFEIRNVNAEFMGQYVRLARILSTNEDGAELVSTSKMENLCISTGVLNFINPGLTRAIGMKEVVLSQELTARSSEQKSRLSVDGTLLDIKDGGTVTMNGEMHNPDGISLNSFQGANNIILDSFSMTYEDKSIAGRVLRAVAAVERSRPKDILREIQETIQDGIDEFSERDEPIIAEMLSAFQTFFDKPGTLTLEIKPTEPLTLSEIEEMGNYVDELELIDILGLSIKAQPGTTGILDRP